MAEMDADVPRQWTSEEIVELLGSSRARQVISAVILDLLQHHEPIKELVGEIAVRAVDKSNAALSHSVDEIDRDCGAPGA